MPTTGVVNEEEQFEKDEKINKKLPRIVEAVDQTVSIPKEPRSMKYIKRIITEHPELTEDRIEAFYQDLQRF